MTGYLVPGLLLAICAMALRKQEDVYGHLLTGGREGLRLAVTILPTLVMLLTAVGMLRASGAAQAVSSLMGPGLRLLGIPPETALLVLIRPVSGSAALAVGAELMTTYGADSLIGRTAAVMLGSTETTFYTISVYFSAAGVKKTRYTLPAALLADLVGFFAAAFFVRLGL